MGFQGYCRLMRSSKTDFLKGGVKVGRPNTRVGFGTLNRPTNNLGISPETIAALGNDKIFNEARGCLHL